MPLIPQQTKPTVSAQSFLPIKEIKDGIVVLKNGTLRTVIMVKASGFDLKSETEQEAIINSFEGFINSLSFSVQILMRSKKVDLGPYLETLRKRSQEEENELLRIQTVDYVDFVTSLTENYNIMSKSFYVMVPHNPGGFRKTSFWENIFGSSKIGPVGNFEREKVALLEKTNIITGELQGIGLRTIQLNTQELIELFYSIYNPEVSQKEKVANLDDLTTPLVTKKPKK
jgi:hypothetical protein